MGRRIWLLLSADLTLIASATLAAFLIRDNFDLSADKWTDVLTYVGLTTATALVVFTAAGAHRSVWLSTLTVVVVLASLAIGFLVNRLDGVARALPILQAILMIAAIVVARVGYRLYHARRSSSAANLHATVDDVTNVLVVGVNAVSDLYLRSVDDLADGQIRIVGVLAEDEAHLRGRRIGTHKVLGLLEDIEDEIRTLKVHGIEVDRIVVTVIEERLDENGRALLARQSADHGLEIDFFADRLGLKPRRAVEARQSADGRAGSRGLPFLQACD
jgi:FlaA1/EpsC-like NDP-sugar epimerase